MQQLLEQSENLLRHVPMGFRRALHGRIAWKSRLIGIRGPRGTGKTTLALQWLKDLALPPAQAAYFSLDDLHFTRQDLMDTIGSFYRQGGKVAVLDEVHKYSDWSRQVKNLHDFFPDLQIVFTGSSIIDLSHQQGDLSRRAVMYDLPGLSFREFLAMKHGIALPAIGLAELLAHASDYGRSLPDGFRPLSFLPEFLRTGHYPFLIGEEDTAHRRLHQMARAIVENDMAELEDFDIRNAKKVLQLLHVLAQQVPFKPNLVALAEKTAIHRNTLNHYLHYLELAKLLALLPHAGKSTAVLQKPAKVYLDNTNLLYALAEGPVDTGNLRETFFLSQVAATARVSMPPKGDFLVNGTWTFEVGGKGKGSRQLEGVPHAFVVKDDVEHASGHHLPLWMFGMLY